MSHSYAKIIRLLSRKAGASIDTQGDTDFRMGLSDKTEGDTGSTTFESLSLQPSIEKLELTPEPGLTPKPEFEEALELENDSELDLEASFSKLVELFCDIFEFMLLFSLGIGESPAPKPNKKLQPEEIPTFSSLPTPKPY